MTMKSHCTTLDPLTIASMMLSKPQSSIIAASLVLLALSCPCCAAKATSRSLLLANETAAFECGKPNTPCGNAVPAGVTCSKGAGWCREGYYCGQEGHTSPAKCLPVPKDCGKAGNVCCPSNAATPHKSDTRPFDPEPCCRDGSTCIYPRPDGTEPTPDPHAGITGEIDSVAGHGPLANLLMHCAMPCKPCRLHRAGPALCHSHMPCKPCRLHLPQMHRMRIVWFNCVA